MTDELKWEDFGIDKDEISLTKAKFKFAKNLNLISDDSLETLDERRKVKNLQIKQELQAGNVVYGLVNYSKIAYIRYELTRLRLAFINESEKIKNNYNYRLISKTEMLDFYNKNYDLFTRAEGDSFKYEELENIIRKKIRELEYEKNVNLLYK